MKVIQKFVVKLDPRTKKNCMRILQKRNGQRFIAPSEAYTEYARECGWFVPKDLNISRAVNIRCLFYLGTKRKCDLTNLLEAIDDIMVHYGTIADDNYTVIAAHDGSRVMYDKENPRTEVYIEEME